MLPGNTISSFLVVAVDCTWCSGECCLTVTSNNITGPSSALVLRFKNDSPSQNQEFSIVGKLCEREVACLFSDFQDSLVHGFIS